MTRAPEFEVGDAIANSPPQILSYGYKKERSVAIKIRQNPFFSAGALPPTPLGELTTPRRPLVAWEGDTTPHAPLHMAPTHLRRSPWVP